MVQLVKCLLHQFEDWTSVPSTDQLSACALSMCWRHKLISWS